MGRLTLTSVYFLFEETNRTEQLVVTRSPMEEDVWVAGTEETGFRQELSALLGLVFGFFVQFYLNKWLLH